MLVGLAISTGWVIYRYGVKAESYDANGRRKATSRPDMDRSKDVRRLAGDR
jgi:hypothetical protein